MATMNKYKITLRAAVVLPFVIIFLCTFGTIMLVQKNNYEQMVSEVSSKQLSSLTINVDQQLQHFLDEPFNAGLAISSNLEFQQLYRSGNLLRIQQYIKHAFSTLYAGIQQIDVISFGSESSEFVGFRKEASNGYSLMLQDERTNKKLVIYRGSHISDDIRSVISTYDPRVRPWYYPVEQSQKAMWSSIYANMDERQEITLSALAPVFSDQHFLGVLVSDIRINTFNAFLQELKDTTNASVYIFDQDQRLVAHSGTGSIISWGTIQTKKGSRLLATESSNPIIQNNANYIQENKLHTTQEVSLFDFKVGNQRYFSQVSPYRDQYGITWFISTSISEKDLLGQLPQNQRDSWFIGFIISLIGVSIGLIAFNTITKTITSTAAAAKHLANGDWDSPMPSAGHIHETSMLVFAFNEMTNNLKASFKALQSQVTYDSLTTLYSREGLLEAGAQINAQSPGSLYLVGIDRFRDINDSLGHQKGDQLLVISANRLKEIVPDHYLIARGGDEFAIYAPNLIKADDILLFANRLLQTFASPFYVGRDNIVVNVSVGVASTSAEQDMKWWFRNSSIALSNAKQDNTRISIYSPEMADAPRLRTKMSARIKSAITQKEFEPFYQPIIDLETGHTVGAEALARWLSKEGVISPLDFIPLAEDTGLISDIGHQILHKACRDAACAIESGKWPQHFNLHVNVSVHQLSKPSFTDEVKEILHHTKLTASNLTLEVTESGIADGNPIVLDNMNTLRTIGISIAIDDFGTGYSSLAYLHTLPFDCLKIDRAFVNKLEYENLDSSIVAAIVNITKGFKVDLVAEGVETAQQAEMLMKLKCPLAQGYLYSHPIPFEEWPTDLVNMK